MATAHRRSTEKPTALIIGAGAVLGRMIEVSGGGEGRKEIHHPVEGLMVFEHSVLRPQQALDQRVVLYSPRQESDTPAKLKRLIGEDVPTSELWLAGTAAGD